MGEGGQRISRHLPGGSETENIVRVVGVQTNIRTGNLPNKQHRNITAKVILLSKFVNSKQPHKTPFHQKVY